MLDGDHHHDRGLLPKESDLQNDTDWSRVRDHAFRRMQILYHQFVVYHNEECEVRKGRTKVQHGHSSCPQCSAGHSAILPRLKDNYFKILENKISTGGLTEDIKDRLEAFAVDEDKLITLADRIKEGVKSHPHLSNLGIDISTGLICKGTHFWDVCNSTVEMPKVVNEFDQLIERRMRPEAIELINKVSKGNLTPYEALELFGSSIRTFLNASKDVTLRAIELLIRKEKIDNMLRDYERRFDESDKWIETYINTVYQLCDVIVKINALPKNKLLYLPEVTWPPGRESLFGNIIVNKMLKDHSFINGITDFRQLRLKCDELGKKIGNTEVKYGIKQTLEEYTQPAEINELKTAVLGLLEEMDPVKSLLHPDRINKIKSDINLELSTHPDWTPTSYKKIKYKLRDMLTVINWQIEGSVEPPENYLRGSYRDLDEMKTDLITRRHFDSKVA
jgi:hypothetical protein